VRILQPSDTDRMDFLLDWLRIPEGGLMLAGDLPGVYPSGVLSYRGDDLREQIDRVLADDLPYEVFWP